ncbi:MAG: rod shape-determining protein MreC [Clostridiales bacterium]|nr:rod shape-determining protein MreC [Clostridiales bacterium]
MNNTSKTQKIIITISIFLLVLITALTYGGRERITQFESVLGKVLTPVQKSFNAIAGFADSIFSPIFNIWENQKLIMELENENQVLRNKLVDETLIANEYGELKMLQNVFDFVDYEYSENLIEARVVSKDPGNWFNMFSLDIGENKGITKNAVVLNGDGLVGTVYESNSEWSKVISIIDNKSSIGMKIASKDRDYEGIINGGIDGELKGYLFDPKAKVYKDDLIITSGKGLYPEGIIIGKVMTVEIDSNQLLINISVKPMVDFRKINRVLVLPPDKIEEEGE